mmetsp:Transcript_29682/g.79705  ORF Transcript_29682/g.79705 Transcript_29682/m.79705 type:complete len:217 (-) Transcript_29682:157-807(-)
MHVTQREAARRCLHNHMHLPIRAISILVPAETFRVNEAAGPGLDGQHVFHDVPAMSDSVVLGLLRVTGLGAGELELLVAGACWWACCGTGSGNSNRKPQLGPVSPSARAGASRDASGGWSCVCPWLCGLFSAACALRGPAPARSHVRTRTWSCQAGLPARPARPATSVRAGLRARSESATIDVRAPPSGQLQCPTINSTTLDGNPNCGLAAVRTSR